MLYKFIIWPLRLPQRRIRREPTIFVTATHGSRFVHAPFTIKWLHLKYDSVGNVIFADLSKTYLLALGSRSPRKHVPPCLKAARAEFIAWLLKRPWWEIPMRKFRFVRGFPQENDLVFISVRYEPGKIFSVPLGVRLRCLWWRYSLGSRVGGLPPT